MRGKMSIFGGYWDEGMKATEGLSIYEHWEADFRPDLFIPRSPDRDFGTSKRLKDFGLYFAYRYDKTRPRGWLQRSAFYFTNPANNRSVVCQLVDWGPDESTDRVFDLSPYAAKILDLQTDNEVIGEPL